MYTWLPLNSPADIEKLRTELSAEYDSESIIKKLSSGISSAVKAILIERQYIDKDYRSTYYNFYAKKGKVYRTDCVRLHFFDETVTFNSEAFKLGGHAEDQLRFHYYGYIVLRPTEIATIGRSIVSPDVRTGASGMIIAADHKVHLLGYELLVHGFPSMDQHNDISVCAHAACWSILRHYSVSYNIYREFLTYDITLMAQQFDPGGLVPSRGLQISHAERVFQEAGTFPIHVVRTAPNDAAFYRQLHAYIESGFPLFAAMHSQRHAIAVVGYEWQSPSHNPFTEMRYAWDEVKSIVVVDDHSLPYQSVAIQGGDPYSATDIDTFIVALPEKIFYPADAVDHLAQNLCTLGKALGLPPKEEIIVRYFITTGSALRQFVRSRESEFDYQLIETIMTLPFAQFVWIVEFATSDDWSKGQISARAVLDATASLREVMPLWLFHSRTKALVFDRTMVGANTENIRSLALSGMETTAFTRWDRNLRPIVQRK